MLDVNEEQSVLPQHKRDGMEMLQSDQSSIKVARKLAVSRYGGEARSRTSVAGRASDECGGPGLRRVCQAQASDEGGGPRPQTSVPGPRLRHVWAGPRLGPSGRGEV